jgi:chromosome segregation ATPase
METVNQSGQLKDETGAIVFDITSGISIEEQQEILAGINAMAVGKRLSPEITVIKAKKKGFLFPLFVNIGAFILLVSAFILLAYLNLNDEQEMRESRSTLGFTERVLIQEIRQETDRQIREKEDQISDVLLKLQAVDAEYKDLQISVESMTAAQKQRAAVLLVMQEEYQRTLFGLNEERAGILEDSRQREADLRAQAEERAKAFSSLAEPGSSELDVAMEELRKLGTEQERANRAEMEMKGFYSLLNFQIETGRLDEASSTIKSVRDFLNAPSLSGIRVFEARKQTHLAAIDAMEKVIATSGGVVVIQDAAQEETIAELTAQNAALERSLAAFTATGADQNKIIAEYSATISRLESTNADQNKTIAEYSSALSRLESSNAGRQDTINKQDSEIQMLRTEIAQREQRVSELNNSIATLQAQYDDLQRRMEAAIKAFYGDE